MHQRVSSGACFAPHGTAGDTRFRSKLKFVFHQPAHGVVVHKQKNKIGRRCSPLRPHAATAGTKEYGIAPTRFGAPAHGPAPALAANYKSSLDDLREYGDGSRVR